MIIRELTKTDPRRVLGVTHREYGGRLYSDITLEIRSYGTLEDGVYTPNPYIMGHLRTLQVPELVELLLSAGVDIKDIQATPAHEFGNLVIENLGHLGTFLDSDDRWDAAPEKAS
jgi:hypothetical protein